MVGCQYNCMSSCSGLLNISALRAPCPKVLASGHFVCNSCVPHEQSLRSWPLCLAGLRIIPSGIKVLIYNDLQICARILIRKKEMSGCGVCHGFSMNRSVRRGGLRVHLDTSGWGRDEQGAAQVSGRIAQRKKSPVGSGAANI